MDIRVICSPAASGVWNMSVDEAMLDSAANAGNATLRFYQWDPPAVSLGYFQAVKHREQHSASRPCDWVRRSTGGGAIVHHHELTYCFTWPAPARGDISPVYDLFHDSLVAALDSINVDTYRCAATISKAPEPFLCFERRAKGDLLLGDHKVGGSAQRRRRAAALQHGSLLWARSEFAPELPGITDLASTKLDMDEFRDLWLEHIRQVRSSRSLRLPGFGPDDTFTSGILSADELKRANQLSSEQFSAEKWNEKR